MKFNLGEGPDMGKQEKPEDALDASKVRLEEKLIPDTYSGEVMP